MKQWLMILALWGMFAPLAAQQPVTDIDLWAFSASTALAPGNNVDEFKAQQGFIREEVQSLHADLDAQDAEPYPRLVTLHYQGGLRVRVVDYGEQAFLSQVKLNGPGRELHGGIKIGDTRKDALEKMGQPSRGGNSYSVFEGEKDVVRFMYQNGRLTSVEIDRGS
ncbi:MAG: hypothetical protein ACPGZP_03435 [Panacagrimonas sp.]